MRRQWGVKVLKFALLAILFVAAIGFVVMTLWNWLMPTLFSWHGITFWQAVGILILSKILFGGFRGGRGPGRHWRRRMMERWEQMTPEQRDEFRKGFRRFSPPGHADHASGTRDHPKP
jgi:hypothetical protein